jgi:hypothetical protein
MNNIFLYSIPYSGTKRIRSKTIVSGTVKKTYKEIKTSRLDFNVNLRTSHGGLVINDGMTAGYIHYALDKNKLYRWLWVEPGLMENTLK